MRRGPARYAGHPVRRAVARGLFRLLQFAAIAAVAIAVAPVTLVAAGSAPAITNGTPDGTNPVGTRQRLAEANRARARLRGRRLGLTDGRHDCRDLRRPNEQRQRDAG